MAHQHFDAWKGEWIASARWYTNGQAAWDALCDWCAQGQTSEAEVRIATRKVWGRGKLQTVFVIVEREYLP
jgi:hypothetical protein